MLYICMEDFNYTVFKVFDGIIVYTVHVISCDVRAWLTQGVMTYCARILTVSDYCIKKYVGFCKYMYHEFYCLIAFHYKDKVFPSYSL